MQLDLTFYYCIKFKTLNFKTKNVVLFTICYLIFSADDGLWILTIIIISQTFSEIMRRFYLISVFCF